MFRTTVAAIAALVLLSSSVHAQVQILRGGGRSSSDYTTGLPAGGSCSSPCGCYPNSLGHVVPLPCGDWRSGEDPPSYDGYNPTAKCQDGTWSYSEHPYASGTCSHHDGVEEYLSD
jgi:hypothetical protein